ncbi:MAG: hypothetical protein RBG13Loki_2864 [Promethearchaeota archaeon CR_4]|nr:MAG: hypothetical protein RBG13Loki_2864 [Candidatus Lokiarchaeota archaeon CR_4]
MKFESYVEKSPICQSNGILYFPSDYISIFIDNKCALCGIQDHHFVSSRIFNYRTFANFNVKWFRFNLSTRNFYDLTYL